MEGLRNYTMIFKGLEGDILKELVEILIIHE